MSIDRYTRPRGLLAGFSAWRPSDELPELVSIGEQWAPVDFAIGRHRHQVWECYLQLDGRSRWQAEGTHHDLTAGMWYLVRPGVDHQLVRRPTGKHHYLYCELDILACARRVDAACAAAIEQAPRWSVGPAAELEPVFRQLVHECLYEAPYRNQALRLACDQLAVACVRLLASGSASALLPGHPAVARAKTLIDQEPGQPWRIADLARLVDCSPSHLAACFSAEIGQPIHRYLLARRLAVAKRLLRESDLPITQLALDLGFSSSQHFAKCFKQATGRSARAWRADR